MNKRQAKKRYKSKTANAKRRKAAERELYEKYGLTPEQAEAIIKVAKAAVATASGIIQAAALAVAETMGKIKENIESEVDNEFNSSSNNSNNMLNTCIHEREEQKG